MKLKHQIVSGVNLYLAGGCKPEELQRNLTKEWRSSAAAMGANEPSPMIPVVKYGSTNPKQS